MVEMCMILQRFMTEIQNFLLSMYCDPLILFSNFQSLPFLDFYTSPLACVPLITIPFTEQSSASSTIHLITPCQRSWVSKMILRVNPSQLTRQITSFITLLACIGFSHTINLAPDLLFRLNLTPSFLISHSHSRNPSSLFLILTLYLHSNTHQDSQHA